MKRIYLLLAVVWSGALPLAAKTDAAESRGHFYSADSDRVRFTGRALRAGDGTLSFDWSGSHFVFRFEGTRCAMRVADTGRNHYNVFVDGKPAGRVISEGAAATVPLAEGLPPGEHTVAVQKRTEAEQGRTTLYGIETDGRLLTPPPAPKRLIEFIGDSHTCGYGTEGRPGEPFLPETENCDLAWGCIVARFFDADYVLIAHSGQGVARNWGDPKEASDTTMRERILRTFDMTPAPRWDFRDYRPDVVVIKLGTNDFSTGISPSEAVFTRAFGAMLAQLREQYGPGVPILYLVPTGAEAYYDYAQRMKQQLDDRNLYCVRLFDPVLDPAVDMGANGHPAYAGQRKMAAAVIPYVATVAGWEMPAEAIR